jgi:hypothetical protein
VDNFSSLLWYSVTEGELGMTQIVIQRALCSHSLDLRVAVEKCSLFFPIKNMVDYFSTSVKVSKGFQETPPSLWKNRKFYVDQLVRDRSRSRNPIILLENLDQILLCIKLCLSKEPHGRTEIVIRVRNSGTPRVLEHDLKGQGLQ